MKKITIVGGDNRLKILKNTLEKQGYNVDTLALFSEDIGDITTSDVIILPVPTTKDGVHIFTPLSSRKITLAELANTTSSEQLILSCNYLFENKRCVDYGALDSYALLNAIPTAEGAIKIAIENTNYTLWKSKVLVIGYGRVGKILADRLNALGADVTVSARKPSDLSLIDALGFKSVNTNHLNLTPINYDIIFNTVDVKVIADDNITKDMCDLIIDLSTHGGLSLDIAQEKGIKTIKAPGLPGKIAPKTAAQILSDTVTHIINTYN